MVKKMGQDNEAERKINKLSGAPGQPMVSQGPEATEKWSVAKKGCRLPMENFRRAVSAPTAIIKNGVAGYLFASDAETITIQFCVPKDWDGASDINIIIHCVLNQAEDANDLIDWETSAISIGDHENILTAGTQTPGVNHDIEAVNADGDFHKVPIVLDYDHATCPIVIDDNVSITISRTANVGNEGYVGGIVVIDMCVEYQSNKLGEEV